LKPGDIMPVGFDRDETLIPYDQRSFPGYLLLFDYFCFPEKFLFFDLAGLDRIKSTDFHDTLEIWLSLDSAVKSNLLIDKDTFCLNAVPVINLFDRIAEPVRITQEKTEYRLIPDIGRVDATEVFSVDRAAATPGVPVREKEYKPFYSPRRHLDEPGTRGDQAFWHAKRRSSAVEGDDGADVFLSFADLDFPADGPGEETVTVHVICTNRDLPGRMPFGDPSGDFKTLTAAPVSSIRCLIKPTPTRRPSLGGALHWRLISHLSLNYLSVVDGGEEAIREILKLYDFDDSPATRQQINGIVSVHSEHVGKRIGRSFCRGVQVTITFDEDKFVGAGLYLFASVLECFMGLYVTVNSFSQLVAKTIQRKERLKKWPPRSGNRILP
jgi:type VI secretion system protein ImpG